MDKATIKAIFAEVVAEMQTRKLSTSLLHKSLHLKSWREFAYELSNRGLDAESRVDGVMFDGGHLEAQIIGGSAKVSLILHDDGDVIEGECTDGEAFQARKGKALMQHDNGVEGYPDTALCIEQKGVRICLNADDVGRLAYMIRGIQG